MAKISVFVKIIGAGAGDDSSIGLVDGNLQWCTNDGFPGWYDGLIDNKLIKLSPQSCNISNGGGLGGFDGETEILVIDQVFRLCVINGTINLMNRQIIVWVGVDAVTQEDAVLKFNGVITSVYYADEMRTQIVSDSSVSLDLKKIPSAVITQEVAMNNPDSEAIGKAVIPTFGNVVYNKMIYCDPGEQIIAADTGGTGPFNTYSPSPDPLFDNVTKQYLTNDYSFFKAKSLLQCVGVYQENETSPVWVALSYNGKELFFDTDASTMVDALKAIIVGKRLLGVSGAASGESFLINDISYMSQEVEWNKTPVSTLWFQLDTTDKAQFEYSLPTWSSLSISENGNTPLFLSGSLGGALENASSVNAFVGPRKKGEFLENVTYFSFQISSTGLFVIPSNVNLTGCEIYQKIDGGLGLKKVVTPSNINLIYQSEKWKLISMDMVSEFGGDKSEFVQIEQADVDTYLLENTPGLDQFGRVLNSVMTGDPTTKTGDLLNGSPITNNLTEIVSNGLVLTTNNYPITYIPATQTTFYIEAFEELFKDGFDIKVIPDFQLSFRDPSSLEKELDFYLQVLAIGEGNVAVARTSFKFSTKYTKPSSSLDRTSARINPALGEVTFSNNFTTHSESSKSLYSLIEKALVFPGDSFTKIKKQIKGFVISVTTQIFSYSAPLYELQKDIKPAKVFLSRTADKKNLWIKSVADNTVTTPAEIIKSVATYGNVPINESSFTSVASDQRTYFEQLPANFDGMFTPEEDASISDVIDEIAKGSMIAAYMDAAGQLNVKNIANEPSSITHEFVATELEKGSTKFSMPKNGYLYSDFDFEIKENPASNSSIVAIDTDGVETFPSETDYELGQLIFDSANGYTLSFEFSFDSYLEPTRIVSLSVRGNNDSLFSIFVPGTFWQFKTTQNSINYTMICRLDNVAPDMAVSIGTFGITLALKVLQVEQESV